MGRDEGALIEALGPEAWAHLEALEAAWAKRAPAPPRPEGGGPEGGPLDLDLVLLGGGLSLLYAAWLARQGWAVGVVEARRVGQGHREWNVSEAELRPLLASGLFNEAELQALMPHRYRHGIVRWHGGQTHAVRGVLDVVVDAEGLLEGLRTRCLAAGVRLWEGHRFLGLRQGKGGLALRLQGPDGPLELTCRLALDGMGASSPHMAWDLACPTVGGVLEGLAQGDAPDEVDPGVGEILASTEGIEEGRQHIWEGFPGPGGRCTTYLFHYAEPHRLGPRPLRDLYRRFVETRPRYKRGEARLVKPTYGIIPAHTRLRPRPAAPHDRLLLVGDAAGRHSPLTFCGFGSMVRSFWPVAQAIDAALRADRLDAASLEAAWQEPPCLGVMGGLALMMDAGRMRGRSDPQAINGLLEVAFSTLAAQGERTYAAFVKDELEGPDFEAFMWAVARQRPMVWTEALSRLQPHELWAWVRAFWRFRGHRRGA